MPQLLLPQQNSLFNFRNVCVNGAFNFGQRGASFSFGPGQTLVQGGPTLDCWSYSSELPGGGTFPNLIVTLQQPTTGIQAIPGNPHTFCRISVTSQGAAATIPTGTAYGVFRQGIENVYTFEGRPVYVSFWARSTIANKIIGIDLQQSYNNVQGQVVNKSVVLTSAWRRYVVAGRAPLISATLTGTPSLILYLWLFCGTDTAFGIRTARPGGFSLQGTGDIEIAHLQIEADQVTPFEQRSLQEESQRLLRLLFRATNLPLGVPGNQFWSTDGFVRFPVSMRAAPTVSAASFSTGTPNLGAINVFGALFNNSAGGWTAYGETPTITATFSAEL